VDPDDPEVVAARIVELLEDPQLARRLGDAGRARVADEFSFERFAENLHSVVDRVVGMNPTTGTDFVSCAASSGP
jgi:glycosyltransferase involved in cell wall biosynthesis